MNSKDLNLQAILGKLQAALGQLKKYSFVSFLVFVAVLYSFVFLRIQALQSAEPSDDEVSSQVEAARIPHIDDKLVKQLRSLQDNSVSVQTLFNEARDNPF